MGQTQTEPHSEETVLFEDKDVKITDKAVYIKWYYFPTAGTKKIQISSIRNVEKRDLGWAKARLWGMAYSRWGYWLAGDKNRFSMADFIGIDVGSRVKPSFTTASIDEVYKILKQLVRERPENVEGRT